ncbi:MAG: bifunctional phosphoribosylaminoimidazolecarboxamide formyltransferase/IMP cyclohydrolase [Peptostreptococcaceae bacterium]|nr:bifunctional phosphoribosylaminoimidazolecarboxamide formyltransferase/IMP cyclohydrolase [Peptostreptococcaceae bacterium]
MKMRALISVSDKSGIIEFAKELEALGVEIISTGGTNKTLQENGVKVTGISEITRFPECLDGRVKTLHPAVHGGILARRDKEEHMKQIKDLGIDMIDIVVINLYPFKETIMKPDVTLEDAIENIDIGGPAMLRSAAKNHNDVVVICDPEDYITVIKELKETQKVSYQTKYKLALKVFEHTAAYDAMISDYLRKQGSLAGEENYRETLDITEIDNKIKKQKVELPENLTFTYEKIQDLRYGENPHQKAYYYREIMPAAGSLTRAVQLHGKELSFNNINDTNGAIDTLKEFDEPAVVAVKHANPCGVGVGENIYEAYLKAYKADQISIFGGIIAANRTIDVNTALEISKIFVEIVIAPDFTEEALAILMKKQNIRLMKLENISEKAPAATLDIKKISGGILIQEIDGDIFDEANVMTVTKKKPSAEEMKQLIFAMKVVKHIKSNGIVIAKDGRTLGIGPGQVNRIWAVENSIRQATGDTNGAVLASDAFFPFDDCVTAAAIAGVSAIIQPGGSMNDGDSIKKADDLGIAMVFTGMRHFKH